jgi:hypothetical protein
VARETALPTANEIIVVLLASGSADVGNPLVQGIAARITGVQRVTSGTVVLEIAPTIVGQSTDVSPVFGSVVGGSLPAQDTVVWITAV